MVFQLWNGYLFKWEYHLPPTHHFELIFQRALSIWWACLLLRNKLHLNANDKQSAHRVNCVHWTKPKLKKYPRIVRSSWIHFIDSQPTQNYSVFRKFTLWEKHKFEMEHEFTVDFLICSPNFSSILRFLTQIRIYMIYVASKLCKVEAPQRPPSLQPAQNERTEFAHSCSLINFSI